MSPKHTDHPIFIQACVSWLFKQQNAVELQGKLQMKKKKTTCRHKNLKGEIIVSYHQVSAGVNGAVKQEAFHSDTKFIL